MKKILLILFTLALVLAGILFYRAQTHFTNQQYVVSEPLAPIKFDYDGAVQRFARAIQFPTISHDDRDNFDPAPFLDLRAHIEQSFPLVHQHATREIVGGYSLLYRLEGSDPALKPALFMGHMDVVPVDESTREQWQQAPFSGAVENDIIWGRGTIDDKISVMALLEAMELMLSKGIQPKRSLYLAFGHDEEVGGKQGAGEIARLLEEQGITFEFVLDEGGIITQGMLGGVDEPVAIIGIAEKGYLNLRLTVSDEGGHSSQPPAHTAAGILAEAIVKVEANPFPANLTYSQLTFDKIGYATGLGQRLPMANLWLLSPLVEQALLSKPSSAASIRTTTAVTMLAGSSKSNILPTEASAVVNFRLLPGDSVDYVTKRIEQIIDNPRVSVEPYMANEASGVSPTDSLGFRLIEQTIRRLDDGVLVAPYLVLGGTDAKHFHKLSDNIYRFMMVRLTPQTLKRFHGVNEQISVQEYIRAVTFYYAMLEQSGLPDSGE